MPLLTSIINRLNVKRVQQINLFRESPAEVQQDTFQKLISRAAETDWGKKHDYGSITSVE